MTSPANGSQPTANSDLPVVRPPAPAPLEPLASETTTPAVASYPEQTNLAEDTIRQRTERQSRDNSIIASFHLKRRVRHPDGGDCAVEKILIYEEAQRREIDKETAARSRKHHRLPEWIRSIPKYVLGFDFALLLYFFGGITNVDWSSPASLALAFALVLAAMVTLLSFGFFSFTGLRLRSHKNHAGTIHREDLDGITGVALVVAVVVIAVLAVLMFLRLRTEVLGALGGQAQTTALVIAIAVAVVNAVANSLVIGIHALDGSDETHRLDRLSAVIREPLAKANRLREQAAKQVNN